LHNSDTEQAAVMRTIKIRCKWSTVPKLQKVQ